MLSQEAIIALIALLIACIPLCSVFWRYQYLRWTNIQQQPFAQRRPSQLRLPMLRSIASPLLPLHIRSTTSACIRSHQQMSITNALTHNVFGVPGGNHMVWRISKCDVLELRTVQDYNRAHRETRTFAPRLADYQLVNVGPP